MKIEDYQTMASETIVNLGEGSFKKHLQNGAMGISIESGEVLQDIQRTLYCGKPLDVDHIVEECGDVLWYISYLLTTLNVPMEACMAKNLSKIYKRYYERVCKKEGIEVS